MPPERMLKVKATAGFVMSGRKPVEEGEELELPRVFAHELISAGKAVRVIPPPVVTEPPKEALKESMDSRKTAKS